MAELQICKSAAEGNKHTETDMGLILPNTTQQIGKKKGIQLSVATMNSMGTK
jgi:hypothetical protein